jgi:hypothetical protein
MTQRAQTTRQRIPTRECNVCVASASISSELEPAPRIMPPTPNCEHGSTSLWRQAPLDEELALLHKELGMDPEPRDRQPTQGNPTRGTASGAITAWLSSSHGLAHQHRRLGDERATRALTSMPMPTLTLTPRRSLGGRCRISPQHPCCCATVQRRRPPRSDGCASN